VRRELYFSLQQLNLYVTQAHDIFINTNYIYLCVTTLRATFYIFNFTGCSSEDHLSNRHSVSCCMPIQTVVFPYVGVHNDYFLWETFSLLEH
jgi:hypothetical protein